MSSVHIVSSCKGDNNEAFFSRCVSMCVCVCNLHGEALYSCVSCIDCCFGAIGVLSRLESTSSGVLPNGDWLLEVCQPIPVPLSQVQARLLAFLVFYLVRHVHLVLVSSVLFA